MTTAVCVKASEVQFSELICTQGTCFVTRSSFPLTSGGLTVVTQHDSVELDPELASPEIVGARVGREGVWKLSKCVASNSEDIA